ncbi:MAG: tRNA (adenosine(37)-N6)-dimethylallyltransferase MiaA [Christensenellaceae bacterium]|jgi:tRNA dimethylallyltransferase
MDKKTRVFIVLGPTASGKTAVAIELAKRINGEIISADSMQIYCGMDIGTAKPTPEERDGVTHHLLDVVKPDEPYSAALFQKQALRLIGRIAGQGKVPVVAGGTGLYIHSITYRLDFSQAKSNDALRKTFEEYTDAELYEMLKAADAEAAKRIHPNDRKRIVRQLEILKTAKEKPEYDFLQMNDDFDFIISGLTAERPLLYERINRRVDEMFTKGLALEAKSLFDQYGSQPAAMQAIGYKEFVPFFESGLLQDTYEEARDTIKRNTRRFAKRQITWFKRDPRITWYDVSQYKTPAQLADEILRRASNGNT